MTQAADLVVAHIPRLRRYARALVKDADRADDLVQECLTRALARLNLWRPGTDMRAWLFTIMHNLFVNECRRQNNHPEYYPTSELPDRVQPDHGTVLSDLEVGLASLLPEHREVLLLVSLEGMSYRQAAEVLEIPKGTVMSRLYRGREQLRKWMYDQEEKSSNIRRIK